MKAGRLFFFAVSLMLGLSIFVPSVSFAAGYPDHPIQFVIPYVAGASGDITGRMLTEELEKILGVKIITINKPGASAVLGTDAVVRGKKDGYTLLYIGPSPVVYAPVSNPEVVRYNPAKDVEPLGLHYFFPQTIAVRSDSPWKTFPEFVDYAKKNPGKIRVSTIGVGSTPHFIVETIQSITGAKLTHVPFEGGESVITAVLGGHVEAACDGLSKMKPHAEAGKLRVLLITNKMPAFPAIPTITELGYKHGLPGTWFAVYAASGIPEEARKVLVPAIEKAVKITKPRIDQLGHLGEYMGPVEFKNQVDDEYKRALEIAIRIGIRKP